MTDRTISLVVALENEIREDDVQAVIDAIRMIKKVSDVTMNVFTSEDHMNVWAAQQGLIRKLWRNLTNTLEEARKA